MDPLMADLRNWTSTYVQTPLLQKKYLFSALDSFGRCRKPVSGSASHGFAWLRQWRPRRYRKLDRLFGGIGYHTAGNSTVDHDLPVRHNQRNRKPRDQRGCSEQEHLLFEQARQHDMRCVGRERPGHQ